ncbi:MAG: 2OG-Fe(II) oxygenase [Gammaproteobacteria bacterium]|nr:2OG-Fe(II) oxygenase [Gammaproteobacteria bacterium]
MYLCICDEAAHAASGGAIPVQVRRRVEGLDWQALRHNLEERGFAVTPQLLSGDECASLISAYDNDNLYRSKINMRRHGFGEGEYQYFRYPLPDVVASLRESFYTHLAGTANIWAERLGSDVKYPARLTQFLQYCRAAGQSRPTPLILKYGAEGYNCLHQDLYGEVYFPFQVAVLLSRPGVSYQGGEFVLVEQRPRRQSRAEIIPLQQGEGVIFATHHRPVMGRRGYYRCVMRHGVSRLHAGERYTLGVIFHDAT